MPATAPAPCPKQVLSESPMPELRRLAVTATDDEVVLSGRVSSYYLKQLAQEAVRCAIGDRKLVNKVQVARPTSALV